MKIKNVQTRKIPCVVHVGEYIEVDQQHPVFSMLGIKIKGIRYCAYAVPVLSYRLLSDEEIGVYEDVNLIQN